MDDLDALVLSFPWYFIGLSQSAIFMILAFQRFR